MKNLKVNLTLPVYNEEYALEEAVKTLLAFLKKNFQYKYEIIIADNASTDKTQEIGEALAKKNSDIIYYSRLEQKGRGRALKKVWESSNCDIVSYMDIDLSTDINAYPFMIEACKMHDIAVGSRFLSGSKVVRRLKRAFLSNSYNLLVRTVLRSKIYDHQCGFKAAKRSSFLKVLPLLKTDNWFFDTELLINAQRRKLSVVEIPVIWHEDKTGRRFSKVKIMPTIKEYLLNIIKMIRF